MTTSPNERGRAIGHDTHTCTFTHTYLYNINNHLDDPVRVPRGQHLPIPRKRHGDDGNVVHHELLVRLLVFVMEGAGERWVGGWMDGSYTHIYNIHTQSTASLPDLVGQLLAQAARVVVPHLHEPIQGPRHQALLVILCCVVCECN